MTNSIKNTGTTSVTATGRRVVEPIILQKSMSFALHARTGLTACSCQQILTQDQPGTQDAHGCPFRHFSPENLTTFLTNTYPDHFSRTSPEMRDILDSVKASHYHVACTRVFEVTRGVKKGEGLGNGESVSHPNKWADRSRELEKEVLDGIKKKEEAMDVD